MEGGGVWWGGGGGKLIKKKVEMDQWLTVTSCRGRRQRGGKEREGEKREREKKGRGREKRRRLKQAADEGKQRNGVIHGGNTEGWGEGGMVCCQAIAKRHKEIKMKKIEKTKMCDTEKKKGKKRGGRERIGEVKQQFGNKQVIFWG